MNSKKYILLTIDVEDWFQVENFQPWIPFETWDQRELRVEKNIHRLLNLFDSVELIAQSSKLKADQAHSSQLTADQAQSSKLIGPREEDKNKSQKSCESCQIINNKIESNPQKYPENPVNLVGQNKNKIQATFFVLGWIADKLPHLVREIHSRGHEIASHGDNHNLCDRQSTAELKKDLTDSKKKLEDIIGSQVFGYRAPNFSVNNDILNHVEECGYRYDSSYNSFALHGRYGSVSIDGSSKKGLAHQIADDFFELPISNLILRNPMSYRISATSSKRNDRNRFVLPWGGGAYFRLMPLAIFKLGLKKILSKESAYLFYMHPWELDPEQPEVVQASAFTKLKHYTNIRKTEKKLKKLIKNFHHCNFITCNEYLKQL
jgi:polysaccharide deacetylase family protein (PEP-CTERM system associated)